MRKLMFVLVCLVSLSSCSLIMGPTSSYEENVPSYSTKTNAGVYYAYEETYKYVVELYVELDENCNFVEMEIALYNKDNEYVGGKTSKFLSETLELDRHIIRGENYETPYYGNTIKVHYNNGHYSYPGTVDLHVEHQEWNGVKFVNNLKNDYHLYLMKLETK